MSSIMGQHVIVLGGTSGIGFVTAAATVAEGAKVTIASRSPEKLRHALDRLGNATNGECVDVTDTAGLRQFFDRQGAFDHLAVTAGDALIGKPVMELTDAEARVAFEVRFWGQLNAVSAAYRQIRKSGSITLVSGITSRRPFPGRGIYTAVACAVEGMVKSLAVELRPVRINGVCPGVVDTELWHRLPDPEREKTFEQIGGRLPVGRVGKPEDIAEAYLYLMRTDFCTGETIVVDGGALQVM